jgi:hypothetical protein
MLATLRELCRARGIPASAWQSQPDLAAVFTLHAVLVEAGQMIADGRPATQAREIAAIRLGLNPDTYVSRCYAVDRHFRKAA